MKKRLVCLILSILMVLPAFVACSNKTTDESAATDITEEASSTATTLTMWVISEKKICNTDDELADYIDDLLVKYGGSSYTAAVKSAYPDAKTETERQTLYKNDLKILIAAGQAARDSSVDKGQRTYLYTSTITEKVDEFFTGKGGKPTDALNTELKNMLEQTIAYDEVEDAFSSITKAKFKANVDILYYTAEEYYEKLESAIYTYVEKEKLGEQAAKALKKFQKLEKAKYEAQGLKFDSAAKATAEKQFYINWPKYAEFADEEEVDDEETTEAEEETFVNIYGMTEIKYPETLKDQVDIIYINGYTNYITYVENEWIMDLTEELAGSSKKLTKYISSALLSGVQVNGAAYAIPTNAAIGEYTYMMIDKELYDKYYNPPIEAGDKDLTGDVNDYGIFLADVKKYMPEVNPINGTFDEAMKRLVWYWDIDYTQGELNESKTADAIEKAKTLAEEKAEKSGKKSEFDEEAAKASGEYNVYDYEYEINDDCTFSIMGTVYGGAANKTRGGTPLMFKSLFTDKDYQSLFKTLMEYKYNDYFNKLEEGDTTRSAISFVKGDASIQREFKEKGYYTDPTTGMQYYPIIAEYPQASEDDLYGNMYAVTSYCKDSARAMKVLTYLNTESELRNVLQYGVLNQNYELVSDELTATTGIQLAKSLEGNLYSMDIAKTGNQFIAYPSADLGMKSDVWESAKDQNLYALVNPLLGFDYNTILEESQASLDVTCLAYLKSTSRDTLDAINAIEENEAYNTPELKLGALEELMATLADSLKVSADTKLTKLAASEYNTEQDPLGESPCTVYFGWLNQYGYYKNTTGASSK